MRRAGLLGAILPLAAASAETTEARVILMQQDATVVDCAATLPCAGRIGLHTVNGALEVTVTARFRGGQADLEFRSVARPAWTDRATVPYGPDGRGDRHVTLRANPAEPDGTGDQPAVWRLAPPVASLTILVRAPTLPPPRLTRSPGH